MAKKKSSIDKLNSFVFSRALLSQIIPLSLRLLALVSLIGLFFGIIRTLIDLQLFLHHNVEESLRQLLLNVITLLAVVEVIKTIMSYLTEGRVKVTYIVDTVLIVMLNEVISLWFKGPSFYSVLVLIIIISLLIMVRLLAIRFSPDND